ncbi:hypothetical protein KVR01_004981 [Diaporthe batatas]|uniref:uncharacterized protein n=1 Tax=Diaporthe batatas TaxID=748121 RepID=UPI001D03FE8F|nr:uncharacterized protein KVR01_004981 [Diaporthe batatas]KAG8164706.1 hypothetical protein KVR01_004981 [Diaporthe batatas]
MIGAVCLSPVSDGVCLFTESCPPNKTLLSTSLLRLASLTGIPLADEAQKSKIGHLPAHRCRKWLRSHLTSLSPVCQWTLKHLDNPHPQSPQGRECHATQIQSQEVFSGVTGKLF